MARTNPFHALRKLAAEHAAADRLRLPVGELRDLRAAAAPGGLGRRELLRAATLSGVSLAAVGAGLASGAGRAQAAAPAKHGATRKDARVVIVGAGIAGLNAALTLADAGIAATVYEANPDRIGGRMYSQTSYWANGQTSEVGGELIDTDHTTLLDLCKRFSLPLVDFAASGPAGAREVLWFDGRYYPRDQADLDFAPVWRRLQADQAAAGDVSWNSGTAAGRAFDAMTIRQWIESRVPGGLNSQLGRWLDVGYNVEYGADTTIQSSLSIIQQLGGQADPAHFNLWGASDERFHIVGGNDQVPHAIADHLPAGTVRLGHELLAVRANTDGTQTLTFSVGGTLKTVTADHTVLAVPLGVLQRLDYSRARFDQRMTNLLRDARMGYCTKLNMQFHQRTWQGTGRWPGVAAGDLFSDLDLQQTWDTTKPQAGRTGILLQYGGGSLAHSLSPAGPFNTAQQDPYVHDLVGRVLSQVDQAFPGTKAQWNGRAQLSAWHRNPYSWGAYSYYPTNYIHRYARYEQVQQGNIHLAGEHTSVDFQGFMNGGAETGERAAKEVLAQLA
ncbi:FAD-dependent oxidoreductase [Streptomyces tateyamensis]|uniref:FAD-dependent oxidoreductase n=1 Tax=Streptomyces tateyamensis TaxID=565073 RepID=A0A2V4P0B7_9ACTN|nr:NAD(P)/FAD-dependent oxidoreductase [Streptomyces tateyamensis]PYC88000.1 FAD-dependent oxidoreductase [Streptomyces tateyamensis]